MENSILYRPDVSRPDQDALDRDFIAGNYYQVFHLHRLVCVCDSRIKYTPDFSANPLLASQDLRLDWSTVEGVVGDVLSMCGEGGALAHLEHEDLTIWRAGRVRAVIHHGRDVRLSRLEAIEEYDDDGNNLGTGGVDRAHVVYLDSPPAPPKM